MNCDPMTGLSFSQSQCSIITPSLGAYCDALLFIFLIFVIISVIINNKLHVDNNNNNNNNSINVDGVCRLVVVVMVV